MRRKFFDLHAANGHLVAAEALRRIAELYQLETAAVDFTTLQRHQWRTEHAAPKLASLHTWLCHIRSNTADGSSLAKAIDYGLKRWIAIERYANSGHLPIDNNPIENAIRPIAIGKNYARSEIMYGTLRLSSKSQPRRVQQKPMLVALWHLIEMGSRRDIGVRCLT